MIANATATAGDILYRLGLDEAASLMYGWSCLGRLRQMEELDELHGR